ncbi:sensor histidine kinase [Lentzea sp. NPDC058436]|uniref:sensor histidine kinase n=1 Tax=Lentzea sp. NPDC058436 TaxID=3346499 RepID=UPI00364D338F
MTNPESADTYGYSVERGMQRSFAALAVILVGSHLGTILPTHERLPALVLVTSAAFVALLAVTATRAWHVRLGPADSVAAAVLSVISAFTYLLPAEQVLPMATRSNAMVVAGILAAGFHRTKPAVSICTGLVVVYVLTAMRVDGLGGALLGTWPLLAAPLAAGAVSKVLRQTAIRADAARRAVHEAEVRAAEDEAKRAAHKQFQRTLHDDVASALRAAATPGFAPAEVRSACAAAISRAEAAPAPPSTAQEDLRARLDHLPEPGGVLMIRELSTAVFAPAHVVQEVTDAAAELLRNVGKHAHASTVWITLSGDDTGFTLLIRDDGVGFEAGAVRATSLGLRRSVAGRLAEIGGTAEISSRPGQGTTAELRWQRSSADQPRPGFSRMKGMRSAVDDLRQPLAAVCLPYLFSMALPVVRNLDAASGMTWLAAWYALMGAATVWLILEARRPPPLWAGVLAAVWTAGGAVAGVLVIPPDSLTSFVSWPVGAPGPMLVVLATLWRWPLAVLTLLVEEVVLITLVLRGRFVTEAFTDAAPAITAPVLALAMGMVIANTIARLGGIVLKSGAERTAIATAAAAREARTSLHASRIADIGAEILPFLRRLATGDDASITAQSTRTRARRLEWMARDELHIPGVLDPDLRHRMMDARADGCVVVVQADTDTIDPPQAVRTILAAALSTTPLPKELTLTLSSADDVVTVNLLCQPNDAARVAALRTALPVADLKEYDDEAMNVELAVVPAKVS